MAPLSRARRLAQRLRRRASLLTKFGLVSAALMVVLGLVLGNILARDVKSRTLDDARRSATVVSEVGIKPFVHPSDVERHGKPLSQARVDALNRDLRSSLSENGFVRMKLWDSPHTIAYSDNPRLMGRYFPADDGVVDALAGKESSEVTDLRSPEEFEERSFGQLMSVYVPLHAYPGATEFTADTRAPVVGAFEIYMPYRPISHAITSDSHRLDLALALGLLAVWLGLYRLVAAASRRLRQQARENEHLALHDPLTGLPNRTMFGRQLAAAIAESDRDDRTAAVLLLDLDRFKEVNDTLGHHHGDALLCGLGPRLAGAIGEEDLIARLGGDEFAVLVPGPVEASIAVERAQAIIAALAQPFDIEGLELEVRASIGVALYPEHGGDPDGLLQRADVAMYQAKAGHSHVEVYDPGTDPYDPHRLALAAEVRRAIDRCEFVLHYQPKLDLSSMTINGVEALLRWQHPTQGLLAPAEFLPVIENTELIRPLTLLVLDMALVQVASWRAVGIDLVVAVNLAAMCAHDRALPAQVARSLASSGLPARCLALELTETSLLDDPERAAIVLAELADLGVKISIDDFGTGYASVAHLKSLPVSELKIDQSFVRNLAEDGQDAVIVQFSIDLARNLGLKVVAEGVEDEACLDRLDELGCDEVQGFFVSRPVPAERLLEVLNDYAANVDRSVFEADRRARAGAGAHGLDAELARLLS